MHDWALPALAIGLLLPPYVGAGLSWLADVVWNDLRRLRPWEVQGEFTSDKIRTRRLAMQRFWPWWLSIFVVGVLYEVFGTMIASLLPDAPVLGEVLRVLIAIGAMLLVCAVVYAVIFLRSRRDVRRARAQMQAILGLLVRAQSINRDSPEWATKYEAVRVDAIVIVGQMFSIGVAVRFMNIVGRPPPHTGSEVHDGLLQIYFDEVIPVLSSQPEIYRVAMALGH